MRAAGLLLKTLTHWQSCPNVSEGMAPFVVNKVRLERIPPFRLLMFQKLSRLPERSKDVFSTVETGWRRHKKTYGGFPYYQGLAWKSTFKAQIKYLRVKKSPHVK